MKYEELYNEYTSLINDKILFSKRINSLKSGYLSKKKISGKNYTYLQHRENGHLISEYIREYDIPKIKTELAEHLNIRNKIKEIDEKLAKIEAASKILDKDLFKKIITINRCTAMELMSLDKRQKSLLFCRAISALEGIKVSIEIDNNLNSWQNGEVSFLECYLNTLRSYNLTGEK